MAGKVPAKSRDPPQLRRQPQLSSHGAIPVGAVFVLCVWTMRLDFPLWCEWSNLGLPPPPSPVVVKDCNPVGTVDRLSGASEIYVVES